MASVNPERLLAECLGKRAYRTDGYARRVADQCFQQRGTVLRVYPCPNCGAFHLTKKPLLGAPPPQQAALPIELPAEPRPEFRANCIVTTGGRDFTSGRMVLAELELLPRDTIIAHGWARGCDRLVDQIARDLGFPTPERYPVLQEEWDRCGRGAPCVRNGRMLRTAKPRELLAFPGDTGTEDCCRQAGKLRVPVRFAAVR